MGPIQGLVEQTKAPLSRQSIEEKVEVFERWLNSKILPLLGLHGTLLSMIYLIEETPAVENFAPGHSLLPALTLAAAALFHRRPSKIRNVISVSSGRSSQSFSTDQHQLHFFPRIITTYPAKDVTFLLICGRGEPFLGCCYGRDDSNCVVGIDSQTGRTGKVAPWSNCRGRDPFGRVRIVKYR